MGTGPRTDRRKKERCGRIQGPPLAAFLFLVYALSRNDRGLNGMRAKRKVEVLPPNGGGALLYQHRANQRLDTVAAIVREQARTFRAVANGKLPSDEGARMTYMLKELRAGLEALPPVENKNAPVIDHIDVISVPRGWFVITLFGAEAHMPHETAERLKQLLPPDAFAADPPPAIAMPDEPPDDVSPAIAEVATPAIEAASAAAARTPPLRSARVLVRSDDKPDSPWVPYAASPSASPDNAVAATRKRSRHADPLGVLLGGRSNLG
jgi:hypothetical protein